MSAVLPAAAELILVPRRPHRSTAFSDHRRHVFSKCTGTQVGFFERCLEGFTARRRGRTDVRKKAESPAIAVDAHGAGAVPSRGGIAIAPQVVGRAAYEIRSRGDRDLPANR